MKKGDVVTAIGYQHLTDEEKKKNPWPNWLLKGKHKVASTTHNAWGFLIKTDKQPIWMNANWFRSE
jgi:hypothetical protein